MSIALVHRYNDGAQPISGGWVASASFAASLLAILGVHELGHHAIARYHGMRVSLPLFLPAPFFVGTLGALLRVHDRPRSRAALLEMGASGPIAGALVIALLWLSRLWLLGPVVPAGEPLSRPLLWWLLAAPLPGPVPPLMSGDPIAYAGWVGALVTALNLLPFGQLDGGHIACALSVARARAIGWATSALLLGLGLLWPCWWAWLLAIHLLATRHPMGFVGRDFGLPMRAKLVAIASWIVWVACFTPIPW